MPDVPHLYDAQHAGGIEDARSARQNDAGGFEGLEQQLRDLISEKLRAWQQWIQPWECPNDGCESVPASSGRAEGPHAGRGPLLYPLGVLRWCYRR
jgi:hypothetical protein